MDNSTRPICKSDNGISVAFFFNPVKVFIKFPDECVELPHGF